MNEGGKVLFTGRNGWVQQTSTSTGLNTYSGYSWWQEPVYDFDYPPDQAGDDDRPHTAFFRELDISNDWGQWWLGVAARQGGVGTSTTTCRGRPDERTGGILDGMAPFALDTRPATATRSSRRRTRRRARRPAAEGADAPALDLERVPPTTAAAVPPGARGGRLRRADHRQRRRDHLDARLRLARASAWSRSPGPSGRSSCGGCCVPAADGRRHDRAAGRVAAAGRERHGQRRRPGRDRGRGVGRAGRHEGGAPVRRRQAGAAQGVVPVPDALVPGGG